MAEGGSQSTLPDPSSVDSTKLPDSHLLHCLICLEQLRQPKYLPCHHSICQECLSSYIVNEVAGTSDTATSFTCPVCRTLTHPLDKSEDKANWAKQFPIDSAAIEMIQHRNRTTEVQYCMPCQRKRNMTTSAQFWCKATQSLFCGSCKVTFHDMIHINCDVVDITGSRSFLLKQIIADKTCDKHKKKMAYYCEDHKSLGCSKCITVSHRKCEDVFTTEDYCDNLKSSSRLKEMMKSLQQGADMMESLIMDFYLQLQSIADDKETALKSIDDLHERIDRCIAEMKKEIIDDLITVESVNLKVSSLKCERLKVAIQNTLESYGAALQRNDHMDTFLLYQRGQAEVESCKDLVEEMLKSLSTISIEHETDPDMTRLETVLNFGKIVVQNQLLQQGQSPAGTKAFVKPLSECVMKELRKVHIKCPSDSKECAACGVVHLTDGRIVVGDWNNKKIKLVNTEGDVGDELKLEGFPCDLCMVDNTTVAVAMYSPGGIRVVTVAPSKLTMASEINTDITCRGIAYRDGGFVVSCGFEVCSVIKDGTRGTTRNLHKYEDAGNMWALAYDTKHGRLFTNHHTAIDGRSVVARLSSDNKHTDVLKVGVVKDAYGVDVDEEGNVYVCGETSNNVVQMSGDGTNVRELLTAEDGIAQPEALSVCGDKLVLTNVSAGQCNYMTVFQLV